MRALIAAALLLLSSSAKAFITVNEGLPTTKDAVYVGTTTPQLLLNGGTYYAGLVPSVSLYVASNTVLGNCVVYSTGSIMCLGVRLSTGDPVGVYVPYAGATANVNLGAKTLTTTGNIQVGQVGAGTSASSNFYFDGLSASGGGYVRIGAGTNQATGYYWGGTRGYSIQERYDLTGTPFTLHDELNNVDRFYLDNSGAWYFPVGITFSSGTSLGAMSLSSNQIHNVLDPTSNQDAATKIYVDSAVLAIPTKNPARVIATSALASNVYNNGTSGVGATLTGAGLGVLTVDGVALSVADRLIVNGESSPQNNGIYTVTVNAVSSFYILTRATDHDTIAEMGAGVTLYVDSGTANQDTYWAQTASVTAVGNSNSPVNFVQTNGLSSVSVTAALTKSGNTIGVNSSSVAVLSSGLVLNNQVDGSSVTKGGALVGSVTLSVTAGTSKTTFNTVGITSNTTAGNYLDQIHVTNGIIDGGVFAAAGGGSGTTQVVSSGVTNGFSLVFAASTTYSVTFDIGATSGTTSNSTQNLFQCVVNGDGTAGHYIWDESIVGSAGVAQTNHGAAANITLGTAGTAAFAKGDSIHLSGTFRSTPGLSQLGFGYYGHASGAGGTNWNSIGIGGYYINTTNGPWTLVCGPTGAGVGISWNVIITNVSATAGF